MEHAKVDLGEIPSVANAQSNATEVTVSHSRTPMGELRTGRHARRGAKKRFPQPTIITKTEQDPAALTIYSFKGALESA
jgi:hypothetical protein